MKKHIPMNFEELAKLFSYDADTGEIRNRIDRGHKGRVAKAGAIATSNSSKGYLMVKFIKNGRKNSYMAHRMAWLLHTGRDPGDMQIDHIDGNRARNTFSNLRLVDNQGNMMNKCKHKNNTSGVTGVYWNKRSGKWQACIGDNGKRWYSHLFEDKFEAICARKSAENRLGYSENHGK